MDSERHVHGRDLHGIGRLASDAVSATVDLVEATHRRIARAWGFDDLTPVGRTVYRILRGTTALTGRLVDEGLQAVAAAWGGEETSTREREAVLAALNGLVGDHLSASGNPLAIRMSLRRAGRPLDPREVRSEIGGAIAEEAAGRLLVLVHGLCRNDLQWQRRGHDHGAVLARRLGMMPLYLHYNSGLHVSANGDALAALLDDLLRRWPVPVERIAFVGHSMGGLVIRSALHAGERAGHAWRGRVRHAAFLGTPHHGAPLERGGAWLGTLLGRSPYTMPLASLGRLRSAGITDLRHGNLLEADWRDVDRFHHPHDTRIPVPLPADVACFAVAGTTGRRPGDLADRLLGDGLVPLDSALGRHRDAARRLRFSPARRHIAYGVHHLDLLSDTAVCDRLAGWLDPGASSGA